MENQDRRLSALLGIAVAFFGVAMNCGRCVEWVFSIRSVVLGRSEAEAERGPVAEYEALVQLKADFLESKNFEREAERWFETVKPDVPLSRWVGVLWSESTVDEKVVSAASVDDGAEEGPAFHFFVDENGEIRPTSRWKRQRPWKVDGIENPAEWIIVKAAKTDVSERRAALAITALRSSACSKGALAVLKNGRIVEVEKRRPNAAEPK